MSSIFSLACDLSEYFSIYRVKVIIKHLSICKLSGTQVLTRAVSVSNMSNLF